MPTHALQAIADIMAHNIRFSYLSLGTLIYAARDCEYIRKSKVFMGKVMLEVSRRVLPRELQLNCEDRARFSYSTIVPKRKKLEEEILELMSPEVSCLPLSSKNQNVV